ncbi:nucleotidyltransferase domain-containing protein [Lachnospiraceae bacterium 56-18]
MRCKGEKWVMNVMPISDLIVKVETICKANGVKRLDLFGSFATGTATPTSDIDFVVYGCKDIFHLEEDILQIDTLRKIDIFDYDSINNEFLLEDIKKYGKQIY